MTPNYKKLIWVIHSNIVNKIIILHDKTKNHNKVNSLKDSLYSIHNKIWIN